VVEELERDECAGWKKVKNFITFYLRRNLNQFTFALAFGNSGDG